MANTTKAPRGRKRAPLTLTTRRRKAPNVNPERHAADVEFDSMVPVCGFTVGVLHIDDDNPNDYCFVDTYFKVGDDVMLNSTCDKTDDVWVGQISKIRMTAAKDKVLVKVRWYWSRNDVAKLIKSFDANQCSPYERILSDDYDYISPHSFQAPIYVQEYDEAALDPPPIGPQDLFVRTTMRAGRKMVKRIGENTCKCQHAYNPYPLAATPARGQDGSEDIMHFCPSLHCRKWYHASCLIIGRHFDTGASATRGLRLLAVDPDKDMGSDESIDMRRALEMFQHSPTILLHLPDSLLQIAQCPIVRCAGAPNGWAIGNVADVVLARRFIYAAIEHGGRPECSPQYYQLLEREEARQEQLLNRHGSPTAVSLDSSETCKSDPDEFDAMTDLCADLMTFDLLASVYPLYWDQRLEEYKEMAWLFRRPDFICPGCGGAI